MDSGLLLLHKNESIGFLVTSKSVAFKYVDNIVGTGNKIGFPWVAMRHAGKVKEIPSKFHSVFSY